jgi:hypothetical protein
MIAQAGLKVILFLLLLPPKCWDYRDALPHPPGILHIRIVLNSGPTLLQYDLTLTNDIFNDRENRKA